MRGRGEAARAGRFALTGTLLASALGPWLVYLTLRPHVGSAAEALAIGGAIPAAWILARLAVTRRVDWIALASVVVLGVAVTVSFLSGGSALPLEVRSSVITGAIGLACVISVAAGRPLPVLLARVPGLYDSGSAQRIEQILADRGRRRRLAVITAWFGVVLLLDATVRVILAVAPPTATFLAVKGIASWGIIGLGLAGIVAYLRHARIRERNAESGHPPRSPGAAQPSPRSPSHPSEPSHPSLSAAPPRRG